MPQKVKRPVLKWFLRILLAGFIIAAVWFVNLIWFRPFSIDLFFERVFMEFALKNPEMLSQIRILEQFGIRGHNAELDDVSEAFNQKIIKKVERDLKTLKSYDRGKLSEKQRLSSDILLWFLEDIRARNRFEHHDYPVNQLFGIQSATPEFMVSTHQVEDRKGAEHYIARLGKFDTKFGQVLEGLVIREEKGVIPPEFVIRKVLEEMEGFIGAGVEENILYTSFEEKLNKIESLSAEDRSALLARAKTEIGEVVFPAYQKLIEYFSELGKKATTDDGVWKLPDGEAYYAQELRSNTTTDMSAEEIHQLGLTEVARIEEEMHAILDELGYLGETIGERVTALAVDPQSLYPDTEAGKKQVLEEFQRIIDHIDQNLEKVFEVRPKMGVKVERIPEFKEKTAPTAYYNSPPLDGSRPGVFYANLRDTGEIPKFGMATLAYHEAIPGHHFQLAIQQELTGVPTFRKIIPFTAYSEGWALYAERLAWEEGFYENDPQGNLGRLQAEMFRAVRLVVDTGIHQKRWTRERSIAYMKEKTGMTHGEVVSEIERYIVNPGQACAYKIGQLKILELREKARSTLGDRFDIRKFHNVVLKNGAVPMSILEQLVDRYISENRNGSP